MLANSSTCLVKAAIAKEVWLISVSVTCLSNLLRRLACLVTYTTQTSLTKPLSLSGYDRSNMYLRYEDIDFNAPELMKERQKCNIVMPICEKKVLSLSRALYRLCSLSLA